MAKETPEEKTVRVAKTIADDFSNPQPMKTAQGYYDLVRLNRAIIAFRAMGCWGMADAFERILHSMYPSNDGRPCGICGKEINPKKMDDHGDCFVKLDELTNAQAKPDGDTGPLMT